MHQDLQYKISPLGDSALIIDFGNIIKKEINDAVISLFKKLQNAPIDGMTEAVPAYSSLAIYYDLLYCIKKTRGQQTVFDQMKNAVESFLKKINIENPEPGSLITIPVCYDKEFGIDLEWMSSQNKISVDEIVKLHTSDTYRVYMLGFLPGFAYMGEVDEKISSPRKLRPITVEAGSVGIAGRQTGIYPFTSPGGWQVIGKTPLKMFNKNNEDTTLVKAGDMVKFISISKDEFENIKSRNA